jgi:DNA-binding NarL/FixJ family response regulator
VGIVARNQGEPALGPATLCSVTHLLRPRTRLHVRIRGISYGPRMDVEDLEGQDREIAELAYEGFAGPHIALKLGLSERAAAARIRVVFAKLGVRNRRELRAKMDGGGLAGDSSR